MAKGVHFCVKCIFNNTTYVAKGVCFCVEHFVTLHSHHTLANKLLRGPAVFAYHHIPSETEMYDNNSTRNELTILYIIQSGPMYGEIKIAINSAKTNRQCAHEHS